MSETPNPKRYDLEERTETFAKRVSRFVEGLQKTMSNLEYGKQLIRSSGSVGANYIEANEALGKKDFLMRIKICRKEAKESGYWLRLIQCSESSESERAALVQESTELMKIFGGILTKSQ
ncbi:MAG: four helix bundle protein [Bacteroidetes bacterium]|nr:four helix bundle protein [Bacteroidota bacterium]MCW5894296.1 four helix bundle protein [Bacteroidota bacterium]